VQAAHAAELLIKARIAEEHPLLIFEQLPRTTQTQNGLLDLEDLFMKGRTLQWADLPDRLWAVTGLTIPDRARYENFGRLRNGIQHFAPPTSHDVTQETLEFIFCVVDPFINQCWQMFAIDYDEDDVPYIYLVTALVHREIKFLVPRSAAECFDDWNVNWTSVSKAYRDEMHQRVESALEPQSN